MIGNALRAAAAIAAALAVAAPAGEPSFDPEQLNQAVSFIHTSVSSGLGLLPARDRPVLDRHRIRAAEPRVADRPAYPAQRAPGGSSSTRNACRL